MVAKKSIVVPFLLICLNIFAVVKVGVLLPLTGPLAAAGDLVRKGIELAHEEKRTVLGDPIQLVYADTRSEKTEAANAMSRLIDKDKVVAVIGEIMSGNSMAAAEIAESRKVPLLCPASTNPLVTQGKRFVSRVCFIDPVQGTALAEFAARNLKLDKIAVFTDIEQDYSVGLSNYFIERFKKYGGKVLQVQYKTGDQEFSAQISQAIAFGSQAILIAGYYNEIALVAQQARSLGFKGAILAGDGANAPDLIKIGGSAVEGLYFSDHYHPDAAKTSTAKKFVNLYEKKYGEKPSTLSALGYDAYMILLKAIENAKSTDPEKIALAVRQITNFDGVTGLISIGKDGNATKDVVILVVKSDGMKFFSKVSSLSLK
ncbi:amino acid/amide ABC transporter substrate-binding protein, HAAT family (TC 3.A.1.4.-) [Fervidobacterium changbaicum]|uniref:Branched-chain amino acid ABC transporter substrate-binding protein n=1 Tax=Fervidobacterium changbaicum TaxID=310769 RepID=A0ABX5QR40_9BACT|nr:ABC transporter substrate-binding protein [Fervidobacterium changbaicum]QAV32942.1 branched-chain amino acid ABC transporter substrate-binding protein [Fervidobacterium changbaicum]SDH47415.1 amino acid/amide ABC transporter substrate-binding protein, HAAT family (TC 3.A.1.4.-) [Fervidobacterium changbaicum]